MADLNTYLISGYDLSGGATNWTSVDLSGYTIFNLSFIWSRVTGTLDGDLLLRETGDGVLFDSIDSEVINSADDTKTINSFTLSKSKINVKFVPNGVTGGRLSIKINGIENEVQAHISQYH